MNSVVTSAAKSNGTPGTWRRRVRRSAPLLAAAAACGVGAARTARAATYYFTGGVAGTGSSLYVSTGATTGSVINTVDKVYNASGGVLPPSGSTLVFDSTSNSSTSIGGGTINATSGAVAINGYVNLASLAFGNASSPTQLPKTLYIDDTLAGGSGTYSITLNAGTGTAGGTDLLVTNALVNTPIEIRGTNSSSATTSSNVLLSLILGSSGNFNVSNAGEILRIDTNISNTSGGAYGFTKTGAGTLFLYEDASTFTGGVNLAAGTLEIYGGASLGALPATATTQLTFTGNSTLAFYSNVGTGATRTIAINTGVTGTFDTLGLSVPVSGSIVGGGSLVKTDTGTLTIGGSTSYSGNTIVNGGTLVLNGANTYGGYTNVSSGTTLNVGSGSSLPSTTALTLTNGTLTLAAGRTANFGVASTTINGPLASTINFGTASTGTFNAGLGAISRSALGTVDINPATATSGINVTTTNANGTGTGNAGGILAGYITYGGGATWAANDGAGNVIGLPGSSFVTDYTAAIASSDFDATTSSTFTNSAINSLRFNTPGVTATTNGSLTIGTGGILVTPSTVGSTSTLAGGTVTSGNGTDLIVQQFGGPLLVTAGITGSIGLTQAGNGTVILDGSNSYTGNTTIQAGTLQLGNGDANGNLPGGSVANYGVLAFNQNTPVVSNGTTITGTGVLQQNGPNTLVLTSTAGTYSGGTVINNGVLQIATTNDVGTGGITINGGALRLSGTVSSARTFTLGSSNSTVDVSNGFTLTSTTGVFTGPGTLNLNSTTTTSTTGVADTGTLLLENTNTYTGGTVVNAGTLYGYFATSFGTGPLTINPGATKVEINDAASTSNIASTLAGALTLNSTTAFIQIGTSIYVNTVTIPTAIGGPGVLYKLGPGAIIITSSSNTYAGGTLIGQGTVTATTAGAYGTGNFTINPVNTAATAIDNTFANASTGSIAPTAVVTINSETSDFNTSGVAFGIGTLNLTGPVTIGALAGNGRVTLNANALTIGGAVGDTVFSGNVSGTGPITVAGPAGLTLSGPNAYTGGTTVTGGVLRANGSATSLGTGPVSVTGGVLAGTGTTGPGAVTVGSGGTITAGTGGTVNDSTGVLTTNSTHTWSGGTYNVKLDASNLSSGVAVGSGSSSGTPGLGADELVFSGLTGSTGITINPVFITATAGSLAPAGSTYSVVIADDKTGAANSTVSTGPNTGVFDGLTIGSQIVVAPAAGSAYSLSTVSDGSAGGEDLVLDFTSTAPEPTSLLLAGLTAAPLALGRRRRRAVAVATTA